jgi:hypothetical protein
MAGVFEHHPEEARQIAKTAIVTARTDYCVGKAETNNIPRLIFDDLFDENDPRFEPKR